MPQIYIYTLEHPITHEIRYIGKTTQPLNKRLKAHVYESKQKNNHKCNWVYKLITNNLTPIIKILDIVTEKEWEFWESYWIEQFKTWGYNLVNQTPGGEGYKHTEETKNKIREAQLGSKGHMYGKKMAKEVRNKISKSLEGNSFRKGKKSSPETIKKNIKNASRYWLGKTRDEETKNKIKINRKGKGIGPRPDLIKNGKENYFFGKNHTEETKNHLRKTKGTSIEVFDINMQKLFEFDSIKQAAKELKMYSGDIKNLLQTGNMQNKRKIYFKYSFVDLS
jgi:group I intron endonuclease